VLRAVDRVRRQREHRDRGQQPDQLPATQPGDQATQRLVPDVPGVADPFALEDQLGPIVLRCVGCDHPGDECAPHERPGGPRGGPEILTHQEEQDERGRGELDRGGEPDQITPLFDRSQRVDRDQQHQQQVDLPEAERRAHRFAEQRDGLHRERRRARDRDTPVVPSETQREHRAEREHGDHGERDQRRVKGNREQRRERDRGERRIGEGQNGAVASGRQHDVRIAVGEESLRAKAVNVEIESVEAFPDQHDRDQQDFRGEQDRRRSSPQHRAILHRDSPVRDTGCGACCAGSRASHA